MLTAHDLVMEAKKHIVEVTPQEARSLLDSGLLLLDVREPAEYEEGHVPRAINIPRGMLEFKMSQDESLSNRQQPILLYCKTSGRAALSAVALQTLGFEQVRSIAGGFDAWCGASLPTDKPKALSFE